VVGDPQHAILQVHEFAGNVDGDNLPCAIMDQLLAIGEAAQQKPALGCALALLNEIGVLAECLARKWQGLESSPIMVGKLAAPIPSAEQRCQERWVDQKASAGRWLQPIPS
jgi:hypothetical protein